MSTKLNRMSAILLRCCPGRPKFNLDAIEFSDKVNKLSVDKMPEEAEFNLLYSGQRKQGDMVVLKIAVGHTADTDKRPKDLETRTMRLLNVPPHLDMVVNYAFPSANTQLQRFFT